MRTHFLTAAISTALFLISAQTAYASPADSARVLEDKAISYANRHSIEPSFDVDAAARELSQEAMMLGKNYSHSYGLRSISPAECLTEVNQLFVDSKAYAQNALAGQYKKIAVVDGNLVMIIAATAGTITYLALDKGNYCNKEKSTSDAYWTAYIFRLSLGTMNIAFGG